jgi:iron complex transport system ATP-binding protein
LDPSVVAAPAATASPFYRLQDVGFQIAGCPILENLSVTLEAPQIYALVGPNGSGKSTLLRLLARQSVSSAGTLDYRGRPIESFTRRDFARSVAFLPQFTPPAESMTVRELVALGRFPWHGAFGRFSAEDGAKTEDALRRTDLARMAERLVDTLSGGERQRVWLAMMLAQGTDCLLLDEPTSALDVGHQIEILALIRALSRERRMGVVIVLHDINLAARYCDEILALRAGRLIARGRADEIVTSDVLERIYGLPMGVLPHPTTGLPMSYVC